ncbi:MAG: dihydropyrimidinase [bacterium]
MTDRSHQKPLDLLVTGGTIVSGHGRQEAALGVREGRVACVGAPESMPAAEEVLEVPGKLIFPGVVDPHVHFRAFSTHIDSLSDVARSAAHGGVTTMVAFATGEENETMLSTLQRVREEGEAESVIDFSLHAWIFEDFDYLAEIPKAIDSGVTTFKVMMGYRKRGRGRCIPDDYTYAALDIVGRSGGIVLVHAENGLVIDYLEDKALDAGMDGAEFLGYTRPPQMEAEAVARSIHLADLAGCPLYIVHLTAAQALDEARRALAAGKDIVVETCPQYLTLTGAAVRERGSLAKVAPPLREEADISALWKGIQEGWINVIGSDHAPYTQAQKNDPPFTEAPFGAPGIETLLPVLFSEGVARGRISAERLVQLTSENPARVLGLYPQKGGLLVGSDADLVVIDPDGRSTVTAEGQHTNSDYTLFEGRELSGRLELSLLRGKVVLREGELMQRPGYGQFIPRSTSEGRASIQEGFPSRTMEEAK